MEWELIAQKRTHLAVPELLYGLLIDMGKSDRMALDIVRRAVPASGSSNQ